MPVKACTSNGKPGWQWGGKGKCYTYKKGDKKGSARAKSRAGRQGAAAHASGYKGEGY